MQLTIHKKEFGELHPHEHLGDFQGGIVQERVIVVVYPEGNLVDHKHQHEEQSGRYLSDVHASHLTEACIDSVFWMPLFQKVARWFLPTADRVLRTRPHAREARGRAGLQRPTWPRCDLRSAVLAGVWS